jgi:hypothetical protein
VRLSAPVIQLADDDPTPPQKARNAAIQAEFERQQARGLQDHKHKLDAQADGVPTRVGLVPTPPADTK